MPQLPVRKACGRLAIALCSFGASLIFGCAATRVADVPAPSPSAEPICELPPTRIGADSPATVLPASAASSDRVFANDKELSEAALIREILQRNPQVAQMIAAWEAAGARYPQVTSLDDPAFGTTVAPRTFHSDKQDPGYRVELSQRFPYPGKLHLRGEAARAEADAVGRDVNNVRAQLTQSARTAFYDYFLVNRNREVAEEGLRLLKQFHSTATARYKVGKAPQQDVLQAEVELGAQRERLLNLGRQREVIVARINALMHRAPTSPLPPPPRTIDVEETTLDGAALRRQALTQRLDLRSLNDRIRAAEATIQLAQREYYPDFEGVAMYDTMMGNRGQSQMAPQVGVRLNLPLRVERRDAAVAEAWSRLAVLRAQLAARTDQVNVEVQTAVAQVRESQDILKLFKKDVLPPARLNVKSAKSAYETGQVPLLTLIESERRLVDLLDRYYGAQAECFNRRATLEPRLGRLTASALIRQHTCIRSFAERRISAASRLCSRSESHSELSVSLAQSPPIRRRAEGYLKSDAFHRRVAMAERRVKHPALAVLDCH